jgi:hypothetical protein
MVERSLLFFCGQMCVTQTLCKKVSFSVIRTFYFQNPQKKATPPTIYRYGQLKKQTRYDRNY